MITTWWLVDGVPTNCFQNYFRRIHYTEKNVIRRRTQYDLNKAKDREHILLGS